MRRTLIRAAWAVAEWLYITGVVGLYGFGIVLAAAISYHRIH
jgi:hypothetical protein